MLVEDIANCWWRKARVVRAENGEIRKRLDTLAMDRTLRNSEKVNVDLALSATDYNLFSATNKTDQKVSTRDRVVALQEVQTSLRRDCTGLTWLRTLLEMAKTEIARDGYISEKLREKIFNHFSFLDYPFANYCLHSGPPKAESHDLSFEKDVDTDLDTDLDEEGLVQDVRTKLALMSIQQQLEKISELEQYAKERENLSLDAETRSFSLPPADVSEKLQRYESQHNRQLYRAMDQLERVQRQRRGETVPPPLNINLGRGR